MRRIPIKKIVWSVFIIFVLLALAFCIDTLSMFDVNKLRSLPETSIVYDADGREIARLSGQENRETIPLSKIPTLVVSSFLAAEDLRFYHHIGIDPVRIGGALIANLRSGDYAQGASTITQQLIKLTHLTSDKTIVRKAREAILALRLELSFSKDEILEAYLNTVYFGNGAYGIEAASKAYFGVSAADLTLSQGALLAGVIKSPTRYAPHRNPENARERRDRILQTMLEEGMISQEEYTRAASETPVLALSSSSRQYAWYVDQATVEAARLLNIDRDQLLTGGFRIYTEMDAELQSSAETLFKNAKNFPKDASDGTRAQAALIAAETQTGAVRALIGGRDYQVELGLNRATAMKRQPGSTLKPVCVYASAIDRFGLLPSSFADDTQRDFPDNYHPHNVGEHYYGLVTLREALSRSLNVASVDLIERTGVSSAYEYARRLGLDLVNSDQNLSLALGSITYGVSPMALNGAYASLANGGYRVTPHLIRSIDASDQTRVYEFTQTREHVLRDTTAAMLTDMLRTAAQTGTAQALSALDFPVAGKTGTVGMKGGGNRDAWTVAYTPTNSVTVWMGFDEPDDAHKLADAVSGSSLPCRLASAFLKENADRMKGGEFALPDTLARVTIDREALDTLHRSMLPSAYTPKSCLLQELYPKHQMPTEVSSAWIKPTEVFDLDATYAESGARITFTAMSEDVEYVVCRVGSPKDTVIARLSGAVAETLVCSDSNARSGSGYYVVPYNKRLLKEGIELVGNRSATVTLPGVIEWTRGADESAADDSTPEKETPLFG